MSQRSDGRFVVEGRKKDMSIRGGENVYPEAVEDLLLRVSRMVADHPSITEYFPGGGWSTRFTKGTRGNMPVTMCRVNLFKGLGPALQIAEGWTVQLPKKVHDALDERTNPTWPTTWFVPNLTGKGPFRDV